MRSADNRGGDRPPTLDSRQRHSAVRTIVGGRPSEIDDEARAAGPLPETYLDWNNALASRIFRPEMAGREVFLFVNDDLIEELGGSSGVRDFVHAVANGPPWVDPHIGLCQKALHAMEGWRGRGLQFPPYVGYLGLFVLAVGVDGRFAPHAYYPRLRTLLGWSDIDVGAPASFDRMLRLWEDLEIWSNQDKDGTVGVFNIRIAGEWIHVGLPKAQAVLTEQERRALVAIFAGAGFDPTEAPSDAEMVAALRRHGGHILRAGTLELLGNNASEPELLAVFLDLVRSELEDWDGETPDVGNGSVTTTKALARICLRVDEIADRASGNVRVTANAEFPEDGLMLESPDRGLSFTCLEYLPGWSSPFRDPATGRDADASGFDWSEELLLTDGTARWEVRLPRSRVRIFVPGLQFDLPGHVEIRRLPRNRPFVLAASETALPALTTWMESGEVDLNKLRILEGLPPGWTLFKSSGASSDRAIRSTLPELALPTGIRIRLRGGIRSGEGNTFFKFAPPAVVVEGGSGEEHIICAGVRLNALEGSTTFLLPSNVPAGTRITVDVRAGEEILRRQSLFLSDRFEWNLRTPLCSVDHFGGVSEEGRPVTGEVTGVLGGPANEEGFAIRPSLPSGRRVFIVGRRIGEISRFPAQSLPEWQPIWIVPLGRRGRAEYCGLDFTNARPLAEAVAGPTDRALWRDTLWRRRKRIEPPDHPLLRGLWQEYLEVAGHV